MDALSKLATPYTPLLEAAADDGHLFLDVTGTHRLFGPAMDIAWRLEKTVRKDMALRPIWTVAPNKLVAKVASRIVKPVGEYIVGTGEEVSFLAPRPLTLLPGIEQPDIRQFSELNISRVGEVAALSLQQLFMFCGNRAHYLHELAHGIDPSPVLPRSLQQPALRFSHIFSGITNDKKVILRAVYQLAEHIGAALRSRCLGTRRLGITLCYTDGLQTSRQASINQATAIDSILFHFAKIALYRAWHRRTRLQSICLSGDRLVPPSPQMEIFPAARAIREKKGNLCNALDIIRHRYSHTTILPGRLLAT
jgi:DNA polymerase-4